MRLRVRFEKTGPIRFSSHKDVVRMFQRCFSAVGVPVAYSEGFHPHAKMSFGPPLRTGWEGYDEYLDVYLERPLDGFVERCNASLPGGLRMVAAAEVPTGTPKLSNDICAATYAVRVSGGDASLPGGEAGETPHPLPGIRSADRNDGDAAGAEGTPGIVGLSIGAQGTDVRIEYTSTMISGRIVPPEEVVSAAVGDPRSFQTPIHVARLAQFVARKGEYLSPISEGAISGLP